jgi:hypothetical protein
MDIASFTFPFLGCERSSRSLAVSRLLVEEVEEVGRTAKLVIVGVLEHVWDACANDAISPLFQYTGRWAKTDRRTLEMARRFPLMAPFWGSGISTGGPCGFVGEPKSTDVESMVARGATGFAS